MREAKNSMRVSSRKRRAKQAENRRKWRKELTNKTILYIILVSEEKGEEVFEVQ